MLGRGVMAIERYEKNSHECGEHKEGEACQRWRTFAVESIRTLHIIFKVARLHTVAKTKVCNETNTPS